MVPPAPSGKHERRASPDGLAPSTRSSLVPPLFRQNGPCRKTLAADWMAGNGGIYRFHSRISYRFACGTPHPRFQYFPKKCEKTSHANVRHSLVPGPVAIPEQVRAAYQVDYGSADMEDEFFALYGFMSATFRRCLARPPASTSKVARACWRWGASRA